MKLPFALRTDEEYCLRFTAISDSTKLQEPNIAFEAFGVTDCTDSMTQELEDAYAVAFTDHAAITNCESEISYATMRMVA